MDNNEEKMSLRPGDYVFAGEVAEEIVRVICDGEKHPLEAYRQFVRELAEWTKANFKPEDVANQIIFYAFLVNIFLRWKSMGEEIPPFLPQLWQHQRWSAKPSCSMGEKMAPFLPQLDRILVEETTAVDPKIGRVIAKHLTANAVALRIEKLEDSISDQIERIEEALEEILWRVKRRLSLS